MGGVNNYSGRPGEADLLEDNRYKEERKIAESKTPELDRSEWSKQPRRCDFCKRLVKSRKDFFKNGGKTTTVMEETVKDQWVPHFENGKKGKCIAAGPNSRTE